MSNDKRKPLKLNIQDKSYEIGNSEFYEIYDSLKEVIHEHYKSILKVHKDEDDDTKYLYAVLSIISITEQFNEAFKQGLIDDENFDEFMKLIQKHEKVRSDDY